MQYRILADVNADRLSAQVNDLLGKGWELYGPPFSGPYVPDDPNGYETYQAMIKKD